MDLLEIIKTRRSIRQFQDKQVSLETIKKLIGAAVYAPSGCNKQDWRFIVITEQRIKDKITNMGGSALIKQAPLGILVLYSNQTKNIEYRGDIQSASAAIENLLLAAHYYGLGACWVCHLPPKRQLRRLFNIPHYLSPVAYVLLGYAQTRPVDVPRKYKLEQIISFNAFSKNQLVERISPIKVFALKALIKIYYLIPLFIRKKWLNRFSDRYLVKKFRN